MTDSFQALELNLQRLQCRQLILTHLGMELLVHRHELAAKAAADGMMIEI